MGEKIEWNDFQIYHTYQILVAQGKARPIKCHRCDAQYYCGFSPDHDDLVLKCFVCGDNVRIGTATLDQITNVVKEHYLI